MRRCTGSRVTTRPDKPSAPNGSGGAYLCRSSPVVMTQRTIDPRIMSSRITKSPVGHAGCYGAEGHAEGC